MTPEEKNEFKELLNSYLQVMKSELTSHMDIIEYKVDDLNKKVTTANGRTSKLEDVVAESIKNRMVNEQKQKDFNEKLELGIKNHAQGCPNMGRIQTLENNVLETKAVKKWIVAAISITAVVMGIIFEIIKYIK